MYLSIKQFKNMRILIYAGIFLIMNINFAFLPKPELLLIMGGVMIFDFLTGVLKSIVLDIKRTSKMFRETVIKVLQYLGSVCLCMTVSYLGLLLNEKSNNGTWVNVATYMGWFNSTLITYIIFIEIVSSLENLYEMNTKSTFSKYIIKPVLHVLTIELKKNPFTTISIETTDPTITSKDIKITETDKKQ